MLQLPETVSPKRTRRAADPDSKLIAAAREFEPLLQEYLAIQIEWRRLAIETQRVADEKFAGQEWNGPEGKSPKSKYRLSLGRENGYHAICREQSKLFTKLQRLQKVIWGNPPTTIEGLRAHALVSIWECQPISAADTGMSFGCELVHKHLFEAVISITGLQKTI